jgi:hypothetical protein
MTRKFSNIEILEKIIEDRKMIKAHLARGGTLEQLKEKGLRFAELPNIICNTTNTNLSVKRKK